MLMLGAIRQFMPGTQARAHWGRARLNVCNALLARARRMIDENGLLRCPSITGLQALTLYTQMLHMTDERGLGVDHWMQSRSHRSIYDELMYGFTKLILCVLYHFRWGLFVFRSHVSFGHHGADGRAGVDVDFYGGYRHSRGR